ncbi:hypothetical protein O152_gp017 [Pseudomonas phage PaBG]|uniref:Uncharacterized protein n=1 Tax=Pseudomonas phage PaBG TaxID=1335230 RepID=S5WK60_9CAUD|nr:hypothetical protein O152_gp017 [Pseudomonas phage PaBG]AGS81901.1 hypothetical protein PaBG_00017 [Pseudomonas phage PaBG]
MSKEAAQHLINLKTRLGKSVPAYAKEIVAGERASGERAEKELLDALNQMRNTKRAEVFKADPELAAWYAKNNKVNAAADEIADSYCRSAAR